MAENELLYAGEAAARAPAFRDRMAQLIGFRTDAQAKDAAPQIEACLSCMTDWLSALDFDVARVDKNGRPFVIAKRVEGADLPTILTYSHGDVVPGMAGRWSEDRDPWILTEAGPLWYGRGIADNKGQFLVNLTAVEAVIATRGALGFNLTWLIEMGEEIGSPGLAEICAEHQERLRADVLLASDGPRLAADQPTLFLGARGGMTFRLDLDLRAAGRHSGNFGGALRNPALEMAHALAAITDRSGALQIPGWTPGDISAPTRAALEGLTPAGGAIDPDWGAPGLSPAERIHAWSSAEILAFHAGDPPVPVNAIPPRATAWVQLRYAPGTPDDDLEMELRAHLDRHGFGDITITTEGPRFRASQTPVDHPAVTHAAASLTRAMGRAPVILPALGGSLPNDIFRDTLGLPTIWMPHSYPGCSQHAPDEHLPAALLVEAVGLMAHLLGDMGDMPRGTDT
ncbi:M20/M25/M40 family metallo-hydrolase [Hasllibacter sp. MH4015]|uniref:M20/M25/M40 family metallo-hydrolase n=1 Tax=Hasllibacter sp. MH4015 TaxID=2854029 RepID=UPI001CD23776|nr:M20/M25/M40 family metallo-hydrolase [Hasllibacter sp. MH4015]